MPELPEVEIIKLGLQRKIIGLKIKKIEVLNAKSFQGDVKNVVGKKIIGVFRRGKMLGLNLDIRGPASSKLQSMSSLVTTRFGHSLEPLSLSPLILLFHLKMSGQIIYLGKERPALPAGRFVGGHPTKDMATGDLPNKSTRVILEFTDNSKLFFNDQRKFGWVKAISHKLLATSLNNLGPEPLEKGFTLEVFKNQLQKRKNTPIKVAIMDQTVVAGVGNIYACEALFLAKIHPKKKIIELSDAEIKKLHQAIIEVLNISIKAGGSSRAHFVNEAGIKGKFLSFANVYEREKQECRRCKNKIKKITLGGRGTYFCENCQK